MALARRKLVNPEGSRNELSSGVIAVLETLDSASVVLAPGDGVLYSSGAALQIGLIKDGRLFSEELLALIRVVRRTDQSQQGDVEIPRGPVGEGVKNLLVKVTPLGNEGFILVLADDVSEADRIDAVRRDFVANISHELKTPIGALSILSEAVLQASDDPEMVKHFATKMGDTANRLTELVQQIISLSRLQDADPLTDAAAVDISWVIKSAVDQSQTNADARGIIVSLDAEIEANVFGDREQLVMALHNLIENAINYSPEKTKVIISARVIGKLVDDNPPELQAAVNAFQISEALSNPRHHGLRCCIYRADLCLISSRVFPCFLNPDQHRLHLEVGSGKIPRAPIRVTLLEP